MLDGTYDVVAQTPMGEQKGTVAFASKGSTLDAKLRLMGTKQRATGTVEGDAFHFSGTLRVLFRKIDYTADGTVRGDVLEATMSAAGGTFAVRGRRR